MRHIARLKEVAREFELLAVDFLDKDLSVVGPKLATQVRMTFSNGEEFVISMADFMADDLKNFKFKLGKGTQLNH